MPWLTLRELSLSRITGNFLRMKGIIDSFEVKTGHCIKSHQGVKPITNSQAQ
jgi:hypothetical protein